MGYRYLLVMRVRSLDGTAVREIPYGMHAWWMTAHFDGMLTVALDFACWTATWIAAYWKAPTGTSVDPTVGWSVKRMEGT